MPVERPSKIRIPESSDEPGGSPFVTLRAAASLEPLPTMGMEDDNVETDFVVGENDSLASSSHTTVAMGEMPLTVKGDVTGITIAVPVPPAKKTDELPGMPGQGTPQLIVPASPIELQAP